MAAVHKFAAGCACCSDPCLRRVCVVVRGACGPATVTVTLGAFSATCPASGGYCCVEVPADGTYTVTVTATGNLTATTSAVVADCGYFEASVDLVPDDYQFRVQILGCPGRADGVRANVTVTDQDGNLLGSCSYNGVDPCQLSGPTPGPGKITAITIAATPTERGWLPTTRTQAFLHDCSSNFLHGLFLDLDPAYVCTEFCEFPYKRVLQYSDDYGSCALTWFGAGWSGAYTFSNDKGANRLAECPGGPPYGEKGPEWFNRCQPATISSTVDVILEKDFDRPGPGNFRVRKRAPICGALCPDAPPESFVRMCDGAGQLGCSISDISYGIDDQVCDDSSPQLSLTIPFQDYGWLGHVGNGTGTGTVSE